MAEVSAGSGNASSVFLVQGFPILDAMWNNEWAPKRGPVFHP
jgi:hypothetical protein